MLSDPQKNISQMALPLGVSVADFGSGSGHHAKALARAVGDKGRVYAIDIQKDLLTKLKNEARGEGLMNIEVIHGDLEKPNGTHLKDGSIDAVVISNILFQIKDKAPVIKEAARILPKGGILLVVDWTDSFGGMGPQGDALFPKSNAETLIQEAGFQVLKEIDAGAHHYGILGKKV